MAEFRQQKILAHKAPKDFFGRSGELDSILRHAKRDDSAGGLLLLAAPGSGASELLKQVYDRLFSEKNYIIPFYFALNKKDRTARQAALRFLHQFLVQTVAYRRHDPQIIAASPDAVEISDLAIPSDVIWIDSLISAAARDNGTSSEAEFLRKCLSAPLRAAGNGVRVFVMIDALHESVHLENGRDFLAELKDIFRRATIPFVFAGARRFLYAQMNCEKMSLEPLSFDDAVAMVENLAGEINQETRDLIAVQFQGSAALINFMFQTAGEKRKKINTFQTAQQAYADALFGGRIGKFYDALFGTIASNAEVEKNIISLLYDALSLGKERLPAESWQKQLGLEEAAFKQVIGLLNIYEIIRLSSGRVEAAVENESLNDYITARFRLEIAGENRALVVGESLSAFLKRAPQTMARFYRQNAAIGLRELVAAFDSQEIPRALIEYGKFSEEYKGAPHAEILRDLRNSTDSIVLPQVVYTAHAAAFYKPIELVSERERSAIAFGFKKVKYTDEDEIIWIAAEIDSKLEASKEVVEFWCDRLEMIALMCDFAHYKLWLIAPEGFSPDAQEGLSERNAFGSSRKQVELMSEFLNVELKDGEKLKANEYEIIVPMDGDAELITAHAIEDIARRHNFNAQAINQIKTALVEAYINAAEHSLSPDRKIYHKFTVEDDRIIIKISNRGLRLTDQKVVEVEPNEGRRGWGFNLMRELMDEVKIEDTEDGTSISMTKYLEENMA